MSSNDLPSITTTLRALKRTQLHAQNRLRSIHADAQFVASVVDAYALPLLANERCGSWYIDPKAGVRGKQGSAYFKSTDGHAGHCVIVDSTRSGKRMPDALAKTIPLWCAVMNSTLFPSANPETHHALHTPPQCVSPSEHAQMERLIPRYVAELASLEIPQLVELASKIKKPLRPIWVTPNSSLPDAPPAFQEFCPVVCCTASRYATQDAAYVQGAGDDSEGWAMGLTPSLFWANTEKLLAASYGNFPALVAELIAASTMETQNSEAKGISGSRVVERTEIIQITPDLFLTSGGSFDLDILASEFDTTIIITEKGVKRGRNGEDINKQEQEETIEQTATADSSHTSPPLTKHEPPPQNILHLQLPCGKPGSKALRQQLPHIMAFLHRPLIPKTLIASPSTTDLAIGIALAALCTRERGTVGKLDKPFIRKKLALIVAKYPGANPSRATLLAVNSFLMGQEKDR
ncbi:MAG: hypothetical protein M1829_005059 [Trizodia sp. TS-e1964]|nr:MAG: hypothetical protein M1829_005059 [Trizodia sp. TS-e1964]